LAGRLRAAIGPGHLGAILSVATTQLHDAEHY
jgi:hypothetical protein